MYGNDEIKRLSEAAERLLGPKQEIAEASETKTANKAEKKNWKKANPKRAQYHQGMIPGRSQRRENQKALSKSERAWQDRLELRRAAEGFRSSPETSHNATHVAGREGVEAGSESGLRDQVRRKLKKHAPQVQEARWNAFAEALEALQFFAESVAGDEKKERRLVNKRLAHYVKTGEYYRTPKEKQGDRRREQYLGSKAARSTMDRAQVDALADVKHFPERWAKAELERPGAYNRELSYAKADLEKSHNPKGTRLRRLQSKLP